MHSRVDADIDWFGQKYVPVPSSSDQPIIKRAPEIPSLIHIATATAQNLL